MPRNSIRVLDLRDSPWVDGPGRTILQTASMVESSRCEILICAFCGTTFDDHGYIKSARELGLRVFPVYEESAFDLRVLRQINDLIIAESIDIIHTHDFRSDVLGLLCSWFNGISVVSTCHGWIANDWKGRVYARLDKFALRSFQKVIAVSDLMGTELVKIGIQKSRIAVVRNALVIKEYSPDKSKQSFREELGVSSDCKVIANIGRLSPEKGQDIFLDAAKTIQTYGKEVRFVLIGVGPEEDSLRRRVKTLGIEDKVVFTGYRKDMREIYNSIDLVVQSSYTEGMPNVVLESMLMELPVIATRVGGTAEVVKDGETALLIDPHDVRQLVAAIEKFLDDESWFRSAAKKGRVFVINNFDHSRRVVQVQSLYDSIMDEAQR